MCIRDRLRDGDIIEIDVEARTMEAKVSERDFEIRRKGFVPLEKPSKGWLKLWKERVCNCLL